MRKSKLYFVTTAVLNSHEKNISAIAALNFLGKFVNHPTTYEK